MKKLITILLILSAFISKGQEELDGTRTNWSNIRYIINENFDTIYKRVDTLDLKVDSIGVWANYGDSIEYSGKAIVDTLIVNERVGIGTTSPQSALHINKGTGIESGLLIGGSEIYEMATNSLLINQNSTDLWEIKESFMGSISGSGGSIRQANGSLTTPTILPDDNDIDLGVGFNNASVNEGVLIAGGKAIASFKENTTEQFIINPQGDLTGTAAAPSLAFGDEDTGLREFSDDQIFMSLGALDRYVFASTILKTASSSAWGLVYEVPTSTNPNILTKNSITNTGIGGDDNEVSLISNSIEGVRVTEDTTFIKNYLKAEGGSNISGSSLVHGIGIDSTALSNDTIKIDFNNQEEGLEIGNYWYWLTGAEGNGTELESFSDGTDGQFTISSSAGSGDQAVLALDTRTQDRAFLKYNNNGISIYSDSTVFQDKKVIVQNDLEIRGTTIQGSGIIADNDATPDVSGANIWTYNGTANSVTVTDLDNPTVGAIYRIIGNSDTYTITINDSGNFNLSANWVGGVDDVLTIFVQADNDYIEISRSNN